MTNHQRAAKMVRRRKMKGGAAALKKHKQKLAREHVAKLKSEHEREVQRKAVQTQVRLRQKTEQKMRAVLAQLVRARQKLDYFEKETTEEENENSEHDDDSTQGSSDPSDEDYDPTGDTDTHLSNAGVADVMRRADEHVHTFNLLTRHTRKQFDRLARAVHPFITTTTLDGEKYKQKAAEGDAWVVTADQQLFITLVWAKHYPSFAFLAFFFQLPARYVQKVVRRVTAAGARWASGKLRLPNEVEAAALRAELQPRQVSAEHPQILHIDGTPIRVKTPKRPAGDLSADEKAEYNALVRSLTNYKHKTIAVDLIVIADSLGRLVFIDGPYVGTEAAHLKEFKTELRNHLRKVNLPIASDAGFQLNDATVPVAERCLHYQSVGPTVVRLAKFVLNNAPYFPEDKVAFFQQMMDSTRFVSGPRAVIETTIRFLKLFAVLRQWRGRVERVDVMGIYSVRLSEVVQFVGAITAELINDSPLRGPEWRMQLPVGAKFTFGYPDNLTVHQLVSKCAEKFGTGRSVEDAIKVAVKQAAAKKAELEGAPPAPGKSRKSATGKRKVTENEKEKLPLPDIVPVDDDDTIFAADVDDDDDDEPVKFSSNRQAARQASKAEHAKVLAAKRARQK